MIQSLIVLTGIVSLDLLITVKNFSPSTSALEIEASIGNSAPSCRPQIAPTLLTSEYQSKEMKKGLNAHVGIVPAEASTTAISFFVISMLNAIVILALSHRRIDDRMVFGVVATFAGTLTK